jgi:DNA-binding response OmpR family regulator
VCGEQNNQKLPERQQKLSTALLIDDDKDILTVLKYSLELKGVNTYGFIDPVLAVEYFRNNAVSYDIVITDIRMPQMNGFEVARAVRDKTGYQTRVHHSI